MGVFNRSPTKFKVAQVYIRIAESRTERMDAAEIEAAKAKAAEYAAKAKEMGMAAFNKAAEEGLFSHYNQYNIEVRVCARAAPCYSGVTNSG